MFFRNERLLFEISTVYAYFHLKIMKPSLRRFVSLLPLIVALTGAAQAQTYKKEFNDLFQKKDTAGQRLLLEKWEKADIKDPELYVSRFNYYVNLSRLSVVGMGQHPKGKDVLELWDKTDSTKKKPAAYLYDDNYYQPELLQKSFSWIDKGITLHPSRLDMRFGKIYMLGETSDYKEFTKEIVKVVDRSALKSTKWTWSDNKLLEDPKKFMLGSIQNYQLQLYNTGNDDLLKYMKEIAEAVLKHYPDHVESLSNLSIVYSLWKNYDKALEYLLKAEKLAPHDYIVLNNIAQAYGFKGYNKKAIQYYELAAKYGDDEMKEFAKGKIAELNKK